MIHLPSVFLFIQLHVCKLDFCDFDTPAAAASIINLRKEELCMPFFFLRRHKVSFKSTKNAIRSAALGVWKVMLDVEGAAYDSYYLD